MAQHLAAQSPMVAAQVSQALTSQVSAALQAQLQASLAPVQAQLQEMHAQLHRQQAAGAFAASLPSLPLPLQPLPLPPGPLPMLPPPPPPPGELDARRAGRGIGGSDSGTSRGKQAPEHLQFVVSLWNPHGALVGVSMCSQRSGASQPLPLPTDAVEARSSVIIIIIMIVLIIMMIKST